MKYKLDFEPLKNYVNSIKERNWNQFLERTKVVPDTKLKSMYFLMSLIYLILHIRFYKTGALLEMSTQGYLFNIGMITLYIAILYQFYSSSTYYSRKFSHALYFMSEFTSVNMLFVFLSIPTFTELELTTLINIHAGSLVLGLGVILFMYLLELIAYKLLSKKENQ